MQGGENPLGEPLFDAQIEANMHRFRGDKSARIRCPYGELEKFGPVAQLVRAGDSSKGAFASKDAK